MVLLPNDIHYIYLNRGNDLDKNCCIEGTLLHLKLKLLLKVP